MSVSTNPKQDLSKSLVPNSQKSLELKASEEVITVSAVEIPPTRTVQEFLDSLDKAKILQKQYEKSLVRIKEIRAFKSLISDGSSVNMMITHIPTDTEIEFPHVQIITIFINDRLARGEEEIEELEKKIRAFKI